MHTLLGKTFIIITLLCTFSSQVTANSLDTEDPSWPEIIRKAKGQTVYFNGWGGAEVINDYIQWASKRVKQQYGVTIKHVKVAEIGEVVSRIFAEKTANRNQKGSVDVLWINGENFKSMKMHDLLSQPFTNKLPHYNLVDFENKKTTLYDFTIPVDNLEAPWGMAQLVFMYDSEKLVQPPTHMEGLLVTAKQHKGRVTYPSPPNFHGTTFLKQVLLELTTEPQLLGLPAHPDTFAELTQPLWQFLDELHPYMWRKGRTFPANSSEMKQLLNDGEIFLSLSFNPNEASNAISTGELPESVKSYVHEEGTIGNTHFLAIPFNSSAKEGAQVFINFLLSPEAQAKKADPEIWGDPTVLSINKLDESDKALFQSIKRGRASLTDEELKFVLSEPHPTWVEMLEAEWQRRYSK